MNGTLYQRFINSRLSLTDHLATARSILANERTFLAYQRTALTELAVAATLRGLTVMKAETGQAGL